VRTCERDAFLRSELRHNIIEMSSEQKNTAAIGSDADSARAAKRAEIEQKVAAARAKIQQEKDIQQAAERERQRIEQEKEARKQFQITRLMLNAQREKDEELAKSLAQKEEQEMLAHQERRATLQQLLHNPVAKITEAKVFSVA
jgi:hypothetical protein